MTALITCTCKLRAEVNVDKLCDAQMIADQHERTNMRRAYAHDTTVEEIAR